MELAPNEVRAAVGRLLMAARDEAIKSFEAAVSGRLHSARAQALAASAAGAQREVSAAGRVAIDDALVALLSALEMSADVALTVGGVSVTEVSDGLAGELFGDNGWIRQFSEFDPTAE